MKIAVFYILVSVLLSATGQILLKRGMNTVGQVTLSAADLPNVILRMASNPYVIIGIAVYVAGTVFWLSALSRVDLSYAYPFASLSYIIMLIASWQLFGENITVTRLAGSFVIILGVFLISRS